jgi:flagellar biosynthesis protein FliR
MKQIPDLLVYAITIPIIVVLVLPLLWLFVAGWIAMIEDIKETLKAKTE